MSPTPRRRAAAVLAVSATLVLALGHGPYSPAAAQGTAPGCADPVLARDLTGPAALAVAGADVVAEVVEDGRVAGSAVDGDATAAEVRDLLGTERGITVDRCGDLYYVEQAATTAQVAASGTAPRVRSAAGTVTAEAGDDVFALHSRPGAAKVVHLDTDGADLTGTMWATSRGLSSLRAGPFDTDGSPSTSSTAEREVVRAVWQIVAEDFSAFDVDVTTQDPGNAAISRSSPTDTRYGTRAVITSDLAAVEDECRCGGVAYLSAFDVVGDGWHARYQPALVFPNSLARSAKAIGEAASHEVGHNLGLQHDGTTTLGYYAGHGLWAPIMGVGYQRPLTQWSRGEYAGASNREDDVAVMAANGLAALADDHADSPDASATVLEPGGDQPVSATGVVTSAADVDWFRVRHAAGTVAVTVAPRGAPADLDVRLLVRSAGGEVLGDVDPPETMRDQTWASGLDAAWTGTRPAGDLLVGVRGGASGTASTGWTAYGSLGGYRLSVSAAPGAATASPAVTTSTLPLAVVGTAYSTTLAAAGGTPPYRWAATGLPSGLALSAAGVLTGRPATVGAVQVALAVTDSADRSATRPLTLRTAARPAVTTPATTAAVVGRVAVPLAAAGGRPPYRWTAQLPPGWSLSDGTLVATATRPTTVTVPVTVTDAERISGTATLRVVVAAPVRITGRSAVRTTVGRPVRVVLTGSGGRGSLTWTTTSLPAGWTFAGGVVTARPSRAGSATATVTARDVDGRSAVVRVVVTATA